MNPLLVTYPNAVKLKQKGFTEPCAACYDTLMPVSCSDNKEYYTWGYVNHNKDPYRVSAPSLQVAEKWLRDRFGYHVGMSIGKNKFYWFVIKVGVGQVNVPDHDNLTTFEAATDAAITYIVNNLI